MLVALLLSLAITVDEPPPVAPPPLIKVVQPPVVYLPSPPPPPRIQRSDPKASANVAALFSNDDYPVSAMRNGEEGAVRADLLVGPDGRVGGCTIVRSSGSSALDSATCSILRRRARFTPARDEKGHPTSDHYPVTVRWVLPRQAYLASVDRSFVSYDSAGKLLSCRHELQDPELREPSCSEVDSTIRKMWDAAGRDEVISGRTLVLEHRVQPGTRVAAVKPRVKAASLRWYQSARYQLAPDGTISRCSILESLGRTFGPNLCDTPLDGPFERSDRADPRPFVASIALISVPRQ